VNSRLQGQGSKPNLPPSCVFCKGPHATHQCTTITNHQRRLDIVKKNHLCFNCFAKHKVSQCSSKFRCRHCKQKHPPPLPKIRVTEAPPFTITGVDFTGALFVKEGDQEKKVYICLFTCAVTRAVHLEVVGDQALIHFCWRLDDSLAGNHYCIR